MRIRALILSLSFLFVSVFIASYQAAAQTTSGTVQGKVVDPNGAVVPNAKVEISYPVSGFHSQTTTGGAG